MNELKHKIIHLLSSPNFQKLATYRSPFDPLLVMGITGRELSYSNVLAWLLSHPENSDFRREFLSVVANFTGVTLDAGCSVPVRVNREHGDNKAGRIDLFVHVPCLKLVVAIEVKIWSEEGADQISRYQDFLARRYLQHRKAVVFLTRFGISPATACEQIDVPVLSMSWGKIADMIGACSGRGDEHEFRGQFRSHIRRSLLMDREEREIVIDLLKEGDNVRTIRRIIDNYPHLGNKEYENEYTGIVANIISEDESELDVSKYRSRGSVKELKIRVPKWTDAGLPFTLMLYKYDNAAVRVLLSQDAYERNKDVIDTFSESSEGAIGSFPKVTGWGYWHSVLASDGNQAEVQETIIDAEIFEKEFWKQVQERLERQMNVLLPLIHDWLAKEAK